MLITSLSCIGAPYLSSLSSLPLPDPQLTRPFSLAWTLNLHGEDIPFKLYFHAYLYVGLDRAILFLDSSKLTESVSRYLESMNVERREYTDLWIFLREREWGEGKVNDAPLRYNIFYMYINLIFVFASGVAPDTTVGIVRNFVAVDAF